MRANLYDNVYDVIFHPYTAMERIAGERQLGQAMVVALFSILIPIWAVVLGIKNSQLAAFVNFGVVLQVMGSVALWVMGAALWGFAAELFGGQGTLMGLFSALGFAHLARVFIVPLWVLAALMPEGIKTLLMGTTAMTVFFWTLLLDVAAIRGAYGVSKAKAFLVLMAPMLVMVAAAFILVTFIGAEFLHRPTWM